VKNYSGGMRRRIDIAASILNTPDLLFLDEPTTGLDPRSRNQVWEIVRAVVAQGTTVLLTTQYLDEADQLASRIAVIDKGKVIAEGTKGELKASVGAGAVHVRLRDAHQRPDAERVLRQALDADIQLEPDPVALTARVGNGVERRRSRREGVPRPRRAGPRGHHRRQLLPGPAEPRRGVPRPHRQVRPRGDLTPAADEADTAADAADERGHGMSTATKPTNDGNRRPRAGQYREPGRAARRQGAPSARRGRTRSRRPSPSAGGRCSRSSTCPSSSST
jgi:hypothetical protein